MALIQYDQCSYKKRKSGLTNRDPDIIAQKGITTETHTQGGHPEARERGLKQILPLQPSEGTNSNGNMIWNI